MTLLLPQSHFQLVSDCNVEPSDISLKNNLGSQQMPATDTIGDRVGDIAGSTAAKVHDNVEPSVESNEMIDTDHPSQPDAAVINDFNEFAMDNAFDELLDETATVPGMPEAPVSMDWITSQSNGGYGGLYNLGNTCYMNSALQMLASLDNFVDTLEDEKMTLGSQPFVEDRYCLRAEFFQLMRCLKEGKTVHPDRFKSAIDLRSSLFVGFRQQDSHEFLTTLLDLLDEDYKGSLENKLQQHTERRERTRGESLSGGGALGNQLDDMEIIPSSSSKRLRTEEPKASSSSPSLMNQNSSPSPFSFSELGVEDIGKLLHETHSPIETQSCFTVFPGLLAAAEPKYKLVGGRMNTAEMILTRYTEETDPSELHQPTVTPSEVDSASIEMSNEGPSLPDSPLAEYFTTEVRIRLTCDSCKFSRTHKEKFWHLSLEIGPDSGSIDEGLRRFFAPEKREIKCEKCFCSSATQYSEIVRLPRALLLHFKRFIVDVSSDYSSVTYRKNRSPVLFDKELSLHDHLSVLTEFMATDCVKPDVSADAYTIRSVVNHIGSSASCGHYTADSHRWYDDEKERRWTRFNDSYVSLLSPTEALDHSRETAYMVMYEISSTE